MLIYVYVRNSNILHTLQDFVFVAKTSSYISENYMLFP